MNAIEEERVITIASQQEIAGITVRPFLELVPMV